MFTIIGLVVVIGSVLGGFGMAGGPFPVLIQPNELVVLGGAAIGTLIIAAPGKMRSRILKGFKKAFSSASISSDDYLNLLKMQFELYTFAKRNGVLALEPHLTKVENSDIFKKYPGFLKNHHASDFFVDALRQVVNGTTVENVEMLLDLELETHHEEEHHPVALIKQTGDALPGLGIVAAVLGIVITMGHLDGGAEEIGHHVAAALVGTFLGILLCYGFLQPIATNIEMRVVAESKYFRCIRDGLLAYMRTFSPAFAVEFARKAIFSDERPTAEQTEKACEATKGGK
jgi:chemotaxis protein MotA